MKEKMLTKKTHSLLRRSLCDAGQWGCKVARAFSCLPAPLEWPRGGESVTPACTSALRLNSSCLCGRLEAEGEESRRSEEDNPSCTSTKHRAPAQNNYNSGLGLKRSTAIRAWYFSRYLLS